MWSRLRLDLRWRDLARGLLYTLTPGRRTVALARLEAAWSGDAPDAIACLSVRSGFDLLLQALALPPDSEVLFSALTIPDMPAIARSHGLVPVPVDLQNDFRLDLQALRAAISPRARVLVVAHLFGARPDVSEICRLAREHGLIVIEDCAQAWAPDHWRGHAMADASMFSFGPIKTATTLGGALCRIGDAGLLARMRAIQAQQPVQATTQALARWCKYTGLKMISPAPVFGLIVRFQHRRGHHPDDLLQGLARSFPGPDLLAQLRRQPARGTVRWLGQRIAHYDATRIDRRVRNARQIADRLGTGATQAGISEARHKFWLFPLTTAEPTALRERLYAQGFDSAVRGSLQVVTPPAGQPGLDCPVARRLLDHTVFLPCYPEMPTAEIDRMCAAAQGAKRTRRPGFG